MLKERNIWARNYTFFEVFFKQSFSVWSPFRKIWRCYEEGQQTNKWWKICNCSQKSNNYCRECPRKTKWFLIIASFRCIHWHKWCQKDSGCQILEVAMCEDVVAKTENCLCFCYDVYARWYLLNLIKESRNCIL